MQIITDTKLDFNNVLLMPKRSSLDSRSKVEVVREFVFKHSPVKYKGTPILSSNMDTIGTIEMAHAFKLFGLGIALHKFYSVTELVQYFSSENVNPHTFYTIGIGNEEVEKFHTLMKEVPKERRPIYVCIDVANGYSRKFVETVEMVRKIYPDLCIMAGNVVTGDMVYDLLERGADIVKVGIGSGSVCATRKITGVGYPQFSAILETADAAHGAGGLICSDGGVTCSGDIVKAFGGGADFVMCGGIFAGHTECGGENVGNKMRFYGMASQEALDKYYGGRAQYRAVEGKAVDVQFKGPVKNTVEEILGGLRSGCTYIGARRLKDLSKCATFVKVNQIMNEWLG